MAQRFCCCSTPEAPLHFGYQQRIMAAPTSPSAKEATPAHGVMHRSSFSGRSVSILLISLVVAQLALLSALYVHNLQLSGEVGEFKSKAQTFEELLQKNGECRCPACPPADEAVRSSLTALHNKFEKTSDKLIKASESIDKKVSTYGRKFEAIAAKVQKFIPMAGLGF